MGIRAVLSKPFSKYIYSQNQKWINNAIESQKQVFHSLISKASNTKFGKDHKFTTIKSHKDFIDKVPIRDYEGLAPYVNEVVKGKKDILWPGLPIYFAKTSGTTSGVKYIPITKDSIPNHINSARDALLSYVHQTGNASFLDEKLIFLSGSPVLDMSQPVPTGRLSGIVNHHVPSYLRTNQMPSYNTNCIDDWEDKLDKIIEETLPQNMSLISGIPPWVQMYFDRLIEKTGKSAVKDIFPNFSLFVYGGVNFEPYKAKLYESIGKKVDSIETYPASEGFIAYQNDQNDNGLLLLLNSGIFFEFIPAEEYFNENPTRLTIGEVELDKNYAVIINNNAGLWGYSIGDTIKFTSIEPFKIVVTGRIKHFISAFGEHVIGEEVEKAMKKAMSLHPEVEVTEFTVAPQVNAKEGLPYHEWFIEFATSPNNFTKFENDLDAALVDLNIYYKDLITGSILRKLVITPLEKDGFINMMKAKGKLGGQNKVPRLSNDRNLADELNPYTKQPTIG